MHPPQVKARALELVAEGLNDCEISRRIGVPRTTVRDWRAPPYVPRNGRPGGRLPETCPRCWLATPPIRFSDEDYAELLGMYLGDGCISEHPRTQRLRIALDQKYPQIVNDARDLLARCFPANCVDAVDAPGCVHVSVYNAHLACVLPQHGDGKKHERPIVLESWQRAIVAAAPWPFIRGCIRSDGCAFINRTDVHRSEPYEYLSYAFTNKSQEIVELFVDACDRVGVFTRANQRPTGTWNVRINRRESVALMLEHVGLKT